jgi:hypothetical protein
MNLLKSLAIGAALLAGGTSLAIAQNGPATGGEPPVAGGAGGNPILDYGYGAPAAAPRVHSVHHRTYMYVPPHRGSHRTITPNG